MSQRTEFGFAKSTLYSILILSIGSVCFAVGYMSGWNDRGAKLDTQIGDQASGQSQSPATSPPDYPRVSPTKGDTPYLPPDHPPLPLTDQHGHPSFDCRDLRQPLPKEESEMHLITLFEDRARLEGQSVSVRALVVGVYPNILNLNWYHLCDAPTGQVLVVSSEQQAPIGSMVQVKGELKTDYDLKGIYRFPLFISEALISGHRVRTPPKAPPSGVIKL